MKIKHPDKNFPGCSIHPDFRPGKYTKIGYGTNINGAGIIASRKNAPVTIGKYCAIAANLRIRARNHHTGFVNLHLGFQKNHGFPSIESLKGEINIGNNVWIADNVIILPGVTLGDGSVLGAGAIVVKDVPAFAIAVGCPAKVVKMRFSETVITQLKPVKWWNWSEEKIKRNKLFFSTDFSQIDNADFDINQFIVD